VYRILKVLSNLIVSESNWLMLLLNATMNDLNNDFNIYKETTYQDFEIIMYTVYINI